MTTFNNSGQALLHCSYRQRKPALFIYKVFDYFFFEHSKLKLINLLLELKIRKPNYLWMQAKSGTNYDSVEQSIETFLSVNKNSLWQIFKLARMCVRYTHYELAQKIYERMSLELVSNSSNMSTSDLSYKSCFDFMALICKAESSLQINCVNINEFINSLNQALNYYVRAQILFKSLCSKCLTSQNSSFLTLENANTIFQIRYCELRNEQIKLYIHLILSSMTFQTIPAPIFQFKSSEVNFAKFGRIAQQMKFTIVELQKLSQKYKDLISECFDADNHTINVLNM